MPQTARCERTTREADVPGWWDEDKIYFPPQGKAGRLEREKLGEDVFSTAGFSRREVNQGMHVPMQQDLQHRPSK